ncbi:hypothetical protein ERO13_D02G184400v2 [Gossypium hirsutum]|uniref:Cyclin-D6-1 isoform X2 n=3 Tax=Gossypium TaxID=3633 RepID=A0A1U8JU35_GOSHI|nr:putative cyclin-D6-1 isoform X2 [Gossypium hirsutum]KAG4159596.1 hypothetical protein ERO13_D02G184400v2 [Gossypium hirsutum]PPD66373.1 hypothetical protein GOBAR_DD36749 [Gossypium barbadense]TYH84943.1 hypothetical protein ES332_D02G231400v1 [Gossypium tomentosum]TYI94615.1 hypothetical protein E1A91_D02G217600v1 [Gossypium mustelinum]
MELDLENPLSNVNDLFPAASTPSLFLLESHHMPTLYYINTLKATHLDISVRREAISSISQLSCKFGPFLPYLAITYLDRFLSSQGVAQPNTWVLRLVAISCVSLAAKMMKTDFSLADFQGDGGFMFDAQTVERMEYLILGALKWRMRSITPLSFVSFFISLFKVKDPPLKQALKARAVEIIFKAQFDTKLLEFKPSTIAASAVLSASHQLFDGKQFPSFKKAISSCSYVNKENMVKCTNWVEEIAMEGSESIWDYQHICSSGSEITTVTPRTEGDMKRRKINDYGTVIKTVDCPVSKRVLIHGPF